MLLFRVLSIIVALLIGYLVYYYSKKSVSRVDTCNYFRFSFSGVFN